MKKVVIIGGDGIGPEVVKSARSVTEYLGTPVEFVDAEIGLSAYKKTGTYLPKSTLDFLAESDACLFGAITTPEDPQYDSPLLYIRKYFNLYANVRPFRRLIPSIGLVDMDIVIVRENTEDVYTGIERETEEGVILERKITEKACKRIVRFAINLCEKKGIKKITCVHKANVMRKSDGLFRKIFFEETKKTKLMANDIHVDAMAAALISNPTAYDCIVTLNLYGDILSDEAAALVGGLGIAPSANIGDGFGLFEPCHGSAPDIAGKGIANPVAAILSSALMLEYLNLPNLAERIQNAVRIALEHGIRTPDLGGTHSTESFTRALLSIIEEIESQDD
ncbi:MAG: isocitrate/isopropylmalate dehydrogenase family protein [Methanomassiliicoccales archaeon]